MDLKEMVCDSSNWIDPGQVMTNRGVCKGGNEPHVLQHIKNKRNLNPRQYGGLLKCWDISRTDFSQGKNYDFGDCLRETGTSGNIL